ncbi:DNA polymerase II small subunit protein [Halorhabdus tiamatea SARL4B]|uniref:DNA polymerase II small subunit n=1 Tax=Halorhabdus tiamatea SARL4B TaxID=1033806 RepID=F7PJW6_9EURY|nr:DNA-directed DNA polymerase II small subunit [Halorhabdus tiamatea]ERJ07495.1 DNA polymerase II small subunit protein [Halorhabdus tiamatea SARL4B]CCQ33556.1 archaeal DNA polymerase II small subunit [Halorhabdus tiamatea SARL4B]
MPRETPVRIVDELASRGYNTDREAVTLLADAPDTDAAIERALEAVPDDAVKLSVEDVRDVLETNAGNVDRSRGRSDTHSSSDSGERDPSVSSGDPSLESSHDRGAVPPETEGVESGSGDGNRTRRERDPSEPAIAGDVTGRSTGTGEYEDFVAVFRDRYEKLSGQLRGRVNHRPTSAVESMPGGSEAAIVGMVADIRSTANGHWLIDLEDTTGTFPALVMKDRDMADLVDDLLFDEVIAVEGTLADDGGILFADSIHFPDVPRTFEPSTADRAVSAALISDVHVGSQEFDADAWNRFAEWLHTPEADRVEYLLLAGDMVEGVGIYPDQDEELDIVDIYDQYEAFAEHLKAVPGDMEIVMIPGNHDAVRLAEPQPAFDEELREIMSAHDARITGNPSTVTVEGVDVLMYHGVSLDEVIAELPEDHASYDHPDRAMAQLLKKRHIAPQFGGHTRIAPEERDYLVMEDVPDVFHTGHVHKLGYGSYHNVLTINSACWQQQTSFQESVNIDPDVGYAPIVHLDKLDESDASDFLTIRSFG